MFPFRTIFLVLVGDSNVSPYITAVVVLVPLELGSATLNRTHVMNKMSMDRVESRRPKDS
jgi:hypothetical protein